MVPPPAGTLTDDGSTTSRSLSPPAKRARLDDLDPKDALSNAVASESTPGKPVPKASTIDEPVSEATQRAAVRLTVRMAFTGRELLGHDTLTEANSVADLCQKLKDKNDFQEDEVLQIFEGDSLVPNEKKLGCINGEVNVVLKSLPRLCFARPPAQRLNFLGLVDDMWVGRKATKRGSQYDLSTANDRMIVYDKNAVVRSLDQVPDDLREKVDEMQKCLDGRHLQISTQGREVVFVGRAFVFLPGETPLREALLDALGIAEKAQSKMSLKKVRFGIAGPNEMKMSLFYEEANWGEDVGLIRWPPGASPMDLPHIEKVTKMLKNFGDTYHLFFPRRSPGAPVIQLAQDCTAIGNPVLGVLSSINVLHHPRKDIEESISQEEESWEDLEMEDNFQFQSDEHADEDIEGSESEDSQKEVQNLIDLKNLVMVRGGSESNDGRS